MEASKAKSDPVPVVVRSEGAFNAGIILDESNYDVWSQLVEMHIAEREKLSFIRGMPQPPAEKDEGYEQWYAENQKVKRWILMSMKPEIMKRYLRLKTAHEIWIALSKAFYDGSDELQVFALNQKAFKSKQGGRSVSEYYGELVEIFRELDHRDMVTMKDPEDVKSYHDAIERLRVHIFLAGLDETFEQVRGEMLRKDLLPSLEECYAVIRREAVRRETLNTDAGNSDVAVMIMKNKSRASRGSEKPNYKCTKCNKSGHTKERCYETRKTIGCGIRRGKLYYLDLASKYSEKLGQAFALEENSDKKKTEESLPEKKKTAAIAGVLLLPRSSSQPSPDAAVHRCSHRRTLPFIVAAIAGVLLLIVVGKGRKKKKKPDDPNTERSPSVHPCTTAIAAIPSPCRRRRLAVRLPARRRR
ncbi:hypothetical protein MRB53_033346 [Persea americana]|uniref:Uncharacterized protein n=1 Tax=Persea americana TaxID=3435 RepID=A0ACC2KVC4_PERAE|nr:hypothetical protein MRB53_033346 [Persea americana]